MMSTRSGRCLTVFRIRRPMDIFGSVSFSSSKSSTHLRGKGNSDSFHNIDDCLASFNLMLHSNPPSPIKEFSKLLSALVRMKHYATVISLSEQMEMFGISHNIYLEDKFGEAVDLFDDIVEKGYRPDVYTYTVIVYTVIVNGLCKNWENHVAHCNLNPRFVYIKQMEGSFYVLNQMLRATSQPDLISLQYLVDGLCKEGKVSRASMVLVKYDECREESKANLDLFHEMQKNLLKPHLIIYNTLIDGIFRAGKVNDAKELFSRLSIEGLHPDVCTYTIIVKGLCKEGLLDEALKVFRKMEGNGCSPDDCSYNVIIQGYLQHNDLSMAKQLIDLLMKNGCKGVCRMHYHEIW
ncbi:pentatricopeptide repeat-containing protein At1g12300, mitochondrial [Jatropha curcas]|uniref:pentatricopeptide repeat-containing protein At1g12300, mitochondrial n=1 Tax=Jatropha curcas TaxID=180498 RepID=UPI001895B5F0|nr:pentatricopeptide repeat-containing protein At1g12300, mitochondrial [Jatropha curcas]